VQGWSLALFVLYLSIRQDHRVLGLGSLSGNDASKASENSENTQKNPLNASSEPYVAFSHVTPEGPFGPQTVPYDIFASSDPKYMRTPVTVTVRPDAALSDALVSLDLS
jgi:hypothetical protein